VRQTNLAKTRQHAAAIAAGRQTLGALLTVGCLLIGLGEYSQGAQPDPRIGRPATVPAIDTTVNGQADVKPGDLGRIAASGVRNAGNAPINNARANVLLQQWRPTLVTELAFVRQMCPDLAQPHRAQVKAAAEQALREGVNQLATNPAPANGLGSDQFDLQSRIRQALLASLREGLSAEAWEHFEVEADARVKRRQAAIVSLLVGHIDSVLYLSPEQCERISQAIEQSWQENWDGWIQMRFSQGVPDLPADLVVPYLEPDQRQVWEKLAKMKCGTHLVSRSVNQAELAWWDEMPAESKDANTDVPPP